MLVRPARPAPAGQTPEDSLAAVGSPSPAVVLIEFSAGHAECLWSQVVLTRALGREPIVAAHPEIARRAAALLPGVEVWPVEIPRPLRARLGVLAGLRRSLEDRDVRNIVFNTCSGSRVRDFLLLNRRQFAYAGVLHDAAKLRGSVTQALISRFVKRYAVLSGHILEHGSAPADARISYFYPVYFPDSLLTNVEPSPGFRVVIPGPLQFERRDYASLFTALAGRDLPRDLTLVLLGRATPGSSARDAVERLMDDSGLRDRVALFDDFLDDRTFYAELCRAAVVLPLIHPGTSGFEGYFRTKVGGSWNLAFGCGRPLLMHRHFERYQLFRDTALFYEPEQLAEHLLDLYRKPEVLRDARARIRSYEEFAVENQKLRYARLLME